MIEFGPAVCSDLEPALSKEWLETNGLGGFASSTVVGLNTRRYHGLLFGCVRPPVERVLYLSKLEETLIVNGQRYELSANQYPGAIHPEGYRYLVRFRLDPWPVWIYRAGDLELEKALFLVHGENTVVVRYSFSGEASAALELRPLVAFRGYHELTHENGALNPEYAEAPGRITLQAYAALPALYLAHDAAAVERQGYWYRSFEYSEEQARGLDFTEDLFNPLVLRFDLQAQPTATVIASLDPRAAADAEPLAERERVRREQISRPEPATSPEATPILPHPRTSAPPYSRAPALPRPRTPALPHSQHGPAPQDELLRALTAAADQFIVKRGEGATVIAGYPWFTDWGRDTMIALPGLTLTPRRFDEARAILAEFSRFVDQGMLPNRFPDAGQAPEYNTVDATLWYFHAGDAYLRATGDRDFVHNALYEVLADIVEWHVRGTRHGIRMTEDGLLHAGEPGVQLTWMDAKVGDWVVTPRIGKPVEIQALWFNALRVMRELASGFGDAERSARYGVMADAAARSFNAQFWNAEAGCLYDVVEESGPDASLRPNQILAVSLPHTMLPAKWAWSVVEVVQRQLLTPYGLRTLSPEDSRYRGVYVGDPATRDGSYHQGTVWPWLMGPFLTAYLRVNGGKTKARKQAAAWLEPFREHLRDAGLGSVSEILDGDPPHHPRGCIAQAWSVAELLRAAADVYGG